MLKHYPSFWIPRLRNKAAEHPALWNHITSTGRESGNKNAAAKEIFYSCKQADIKSSNMPKLDSKSEFVHSTKTSPPELSSSPNVKKYSCFPWLWRWSFVFYAVSVDQTPCSSRSSRASYHPHSPQYIWILAALALHMKTFQYWVVWY